MNALDTNILVRFLTGDDKVQSKKVYEIFKKSEIDKKELFIPLLVVLELIWVLESVYKYKRIEILDSISNLLLLPVLKFEHQSVVNQFVFSAKDNNDKFFDLSDLLIAHSAIVQGCETTLTFDKKASKFSLFKLVK